MGKVNRTQREDALDIWHVLGSIVVGDERVKELFHVFFTRSPPLQMREQRIQRPEICVAPSPA
jgi:hypothetical protein